ncbi:DUF6515 family protein [Aquabacterium sp.]|uniref:DUF6515 family protein n=1 Tax=Aquabacterium sp. TaxID=1872578 RepID=UPI002B9FFE9B|nr:DUF6515 family protein [Aquabacterium sp.]HSW06385.1 DUF6515 family protein [Aquabacterium sp.]
MTLLLAAGVPAAFGQEGRHEGRQGGGGREGPPSATREAQPSAGRAGPPQQSAPRPIDQRVQSGGHRGDGSRWWDGAHGHSHYYPTPGWAVRSLPSRSRVVFWSGVNYGYYDGVWYAPGPRGYAVVRPPYGIVVADLPAFRTLVTIGGLSYLYANGVYYRERPEGDYEVVPTPVDNAAGGPSSDKLFVYPRQGQTAQQQASDEYDCHRWAASQTGFDPTAAAVGQPSGDVMRRGDYQRARSACLEGRNYTVR